MTDRPQSLYRDRVCSASCRDIYFRSRRGLGWCYDRVFYHDPQTNALRATESARASAIEDFCRDKEFSIGTDFLVFSIVTKIFLSR